jgi:hypothetical protein
MSIWCTSKSSATTMASMMRMDANLATSANILEKSMLGVWENPFATSWAWYLSISSFAFGLIRKTHLQLITFRP